MRPAQLHALAACLRTLGVDPARMSATDGAAESAVYLAQELGAPLLYAFGWDAGRPRCPELAVDLEWVAGDRGRSPFRVATGLRGRLRVLRGVLEETPPSLAPARWLVLLAAWHHLRAVERRGVEGATAALVHDGSRLARHAAAAEAALQSLQLLPMSPAGAAPASDAPSPAMPAAEPVPGGGEAS